MKIFKYTLNALSSFRKNKLRSVLSTLGIVIGIASVSIIMALGEGMKQVMLEELSNSSDTIQINQKNGGGYWDEQSTEAKGAKVEESQYVQVKEVFNDETIEKIKKYVGNVKYVTAYGSTYGGEMTFEGKEVWSSIVGVTEDYLKAKNIKIEVGMGLSKKNYENEDKVAVVGANFVKYGIEGKNPVGKKIMIGGYSFQIIGILEKTNDRQVNSSIIIPSTTAKSSLGMQKYENIYVYVKDIMKMDSTKKDVAYLMMKLSGVENPSDVKFSIWSDEEILKDINKTIGILKLFLGGIAGISLLVGGIGIMNIMLVSVVERTREIGIRKAIGAKRKDILLQFLVESVLISIIGCIIAFIITFIGVFLINYISEMLGDDLNIKAIINGDVILLSSGISMLMGIIFGILPAWKAAKMKPIDALRFE